MPGPAEVVGWSVGVVPGPAEWVPRSGAVPGRHGAGAAGAQDGQPPARRLGPLLQGAHRPGGHGEVLHRYPGMRTAHYPRIDGIVQL